MRRARTVAAGMILGAVISACELLTPGSPSDSGAPASPPASQGSPASAQPQATEPGIVAPSAEDPKPSPTMEVPPPAS